MGKPAAKPKSTPRERTSSPSELASFAGVHRTTIYEWAKLPGYPIASDGTVCKWELCEWFIGRSMNQGSPGGDGEDDWQSGDSPNLERFRLWRAKIAELEFNEKSKALVSRENMHGFVMRVAGLFRGWLDRLQRQHGEEVYQTGVHLLEDIESETAREFGPDGEPLSDAS